MTGTQFQEALRALRRQEPFQPFEVELIDGRRFTVDSPEALGFDGGAAAFIAEDGSLYFFGSEQVRRLGEGSTTTAI